MKKSEWIKILENLPGDPEVCIFDWMKNMRDSALEASGSGIYPDVEIKLESGDDIPKGDDPWISVSFKNPDYIVDELDISAN